MRFRPHAECPMPRSLSRLQLYAITQRRRDVCNTRRGQSTAEPTVNSQRFRSYQTVKCCCTKPSRALTCSTNQHLVTVHACLTPSQLRCLNGCVWPHAYADHRHGLKCVNENGDAQVAVLELSHWSVLGHSKWVPLIVARGLDRRWRSSAILGRLSASGLDRGRVYDHVRETVGEEYPRRTRVPPLTWSFPCRLAPKPAWKRAKGGKRRGEVARVTVVGDRGSFRSSRTLTDRGMETDSAA